jgi:hypothetical protein
MTVRAVTASLTSTSPSTLHLSTPPPSLPVAVVCPSPLSLHPPPLPPLPCSHDGDVTGEGTAASVMGRREEGRDGGDEESHCVRGEVLRQGGVDGERDGLV